MHNTKRNSKAILPLEVWIKIGKRVMKADAYNMSILVTNEDDAYNMSILVENAYRPKSDNSSSLQ